jgi:ATP synthase F1 epsilon subunit
MKLEIVTETDIVFSGEVGQVTLSSVRGEMGILPEHLPLIAEMDPSVVSFVDSRENSKLQKIVVEAGYVHLENDTISLITSEVKNALPNDQVEKIRSELAEISSDLFGGESEEKMSATLLARKKYLESLLSLTTS